MISRYDLTSDELKIIEQLRQQQFNAQKDKSQALASKICTMYQSPEQAMKAIPTAVHDAFAKQGIHITSCYLELDKLWAENSYITYNFTYDEHKSTGYFSDLFFRLYDDNELKYPESINDWICELKKYLPPKDRGSISYFDDMIFDPPEIKVSKFYGVDPNEMIESYKRSVFDEMQEYIDEVKPYYEEVHMINCIVAELKAVQKSQEAQ